DFEKIGDDSLGYISVAQEGQANKDIPFPIKRVYWIYNTPKSVERGNHALMKTDQVLVVIRGELHIALENTLGKKFDFTINKPNEGLFVPAGYWKVISLSADAVLLSISSRTYEEDEYIRDYNAFK